MALIKCPECGKEVSTNASACPVCGNRKLKKRKTSLLGKVFIVICIFIVIGLLFGDNENINSPKAEDAETQYQRGYQFAHGEKRDYAAAIRWYNKAAEQGYTPAEYELGEIYMFEYDFMDTQKGLEFYQKAADKNYAPAQSSLGAVYEIGYNNIPQNYKKAIEWYQKAADNNDLFALSALGDIYYEGKNVPKNYKKAFELYYKVAVSDNISEEWRGYMTVAQYKLGEIFYKGYGVPKDFKKAFEWYQKAAEANPPHPVAQRTLGVMYEKGEGVPQNYTKAIEWYQKAVDYGLGSLGEDAKHLERLKQKYGK
jgi:TPR repeat protein/DNA-directed RNA polymerase subunit RPC12/RpoP